MTTRKSYWMSERGTLTANELKRKSACHAKGGSGGSVSSCWQRKLSDVERIRNVGSPSLARLTNETVLAVYRASEDVVGEEGQHLRVTTSRAGEGKGWKVSTAFEEVGKFHNNDWKRGSGMPMWDPIVFAERDGKGRAFVFYAVSDSQRRGECRQEKSVPLLGFGSKPIKPWVRGGDIYVVASTDATLKEWMTPRRVLKSADFNGAPITLNGPAVEMDEANSETGNRDWVVPVCVNGMKQVNVGTVLAQYGRGVQREGGTGEGGFNPRCGAEAVRKCGVIVSSDLGKTWDTSRLHESLGFDRKNGILLADMTVAEIGEGGLYAVFRPKMVVGGEDDGLVVRRTAKSMRLYTAISTDVGKTWTTPREMSSEMRTFDAAARLFRLQPKGPLVLAYNDRSNFDTLEGEDGVSDEENDDDESIGSSSGSRSSETSKSSRSSSSSNSASFSDAATNLGALRLTLATSHDHGRTWRKVVTVRDGATTTSVGNTNTDESNDSTRSIALHRQQQQRKTLGLRVSQPWLLQHGCKAFVAFSRDYHALEYSSRFARAQPENDRELGLRAQSSKSTILTVLKIIPLALYLRAASCKLALPILGCDGPLCPVAIGKSGDCTPTANTAECYAWCEHAWTPWANNLLSTFKIPYKVRCNKSNGYEFAKIIAAVEIIGYLMLWMPGKAKKGAFILTATMAFGIHFHVTFLKDSVDKLGLQFALILASLAVYVMETDGKKSGSKPRPPKRGGSKKRN
ncbi:unnamed protein product [Bathycoccus prasinos]